MLFKTWIISRHIHRHIKNREVTSWQDGGKTFTSERMDAGKLGIPRAARTDTLFTVMCMVRHTAKQNPNAHS